MPKFRRTRTTVYPEIAGLCSCGDPKVVTTQWERIGKEPEFACQITCVNCAAGVHSSKGSESGEEAFKSAEEKWLVKVSGDFKDKAAVLRKASDTMWEKAKQVDNILKGVQ